MKKYFIFLIIFLMTPISSYLYSMEMNVNEIKQNIQTRIAKGDDLDKPDTVGIIPLIFAAQQNDANLAQKLISSKADVNVQDNSGSTPSASAIRQGNIALAHFLIQHGARGDIADENGDTPHSLAHDYSLSDIVKRIESKKITPEKGKEKETKEALEKPQTTKPLKKYKKKSQRAFTVLCLANARNSSVETQKKLLTMFTEEKAQLKSSAKKSSTTQDNWYQLFTAVSENNLEKVTRLLEDKNTDINAQTPSDWTALAHACDQLNVEMVQKLVEHDTIIIDLPLKRGTTPLIIAAAKVALASQDDKIGKRAFKIVKLLLEHGAHINAQDNDGATALIKALMNGNIKTAKLLIKLGADTSIKDKYGFGALFYAAGKGYLPIVEKLIKVGVAIDKTTQAWNASIQAISEEHQEVGKALQEAAANLLEEVEEVIKEEEKRTQITTRKAPIKLNAEFHQRNFMKMNQMFYKHLRPITKSEFCEMSKETLKKCLEITASKLRYINEDDIRNALELGNKLLSRSFEQTNEWYWITHRISDKIFEDQCEIINILSQWLIAKNIRLKKTPLVLALASGATEIAQWLIEEGIDVNSDEIIENSPLMWAIFCEQSEIVKKLIKAGANINEDSAKTTPLIGAILTEQIDIAHSLINAGVDVNKIDKNGYSPLSAATLKKQTETAKLLIKAGANININVKQSNNGDNQITFLQVLAVNPEYLEIFKCILANHPDLSQETRTRMRIWAKRTNNQQAIEALDSFIDDNLGSFHKIPNNTSQNKPHQSRNIVHIIEESTQRPVDLIELVDVLKKYNLLDEQSLADIQEVTNEKLYLVQEPKSNIKKENQLSQERKHITDLDQEKTKKPGSLIELAAVFDEYTRSNESLESIITKKSREVYSALENTIQKIEAFQELFEKNKSILSLEEIEKEDITKYCNELKVQLITLQIPLSDAYANDEKIYEEIMQQQEQILRSIFELEKNLGMVPSNPGGFPGL